MPNEADCPIFVNADLIASGLSPFQPARSAIRAGRLMLEEITAHAQRGDSFAFETTLAGRSYLRMIRDWREQNYQIKLFFLSLSSPEEAIARVAARVAQGGHYVSDDVVRRRFFAGLQNFHKLYRLEVDFWRLYDNSSDMIKLIDEGENL